MISRFKVTNRSKLGKDFLEYNFKDHLTIEDKPWVFLLLLDIVYYFRRRQVLIGQDELKHVEVSKDFFKSEDKDRPVEYELDVIDKENNTWTFTLAALDEKIMFESISKNLKPVVVYDRLSNNFTCFEENQVPDIKKAEIVLNLVEKFNLTIDYDGSILLDCFDLGDRIIKQELRDTIIIQEDNIDFFYTRIGNLIEKTIEWYNERFPGMNTKYVLEKSMPLFGFDYDNITGNFELQSSTYDNPWAIPLQGCGAGLTRFIKIFPALYAARMYGVNVICTQFAISLHPLLIKKLLEFFKLENKGQLIIMDDGRIIQ